MDHHHLMSAMNVAIECNNLGVNLLEDGCYSAAMETFRVAVKLMNPVSKNFEQKIIVEAPLAETEAIEVIRRAKYKMEQTQRTSAQKKRKFCMRAVVPERDSEIFTPPMKLQRLTSKPCSCTKDYAILVFNLGLAYYCNGTQRNLRESVCLFDVAYSLASTNYRHDTTLLKVSMASLNNAGQIHHSLANYDLARRSLQCLGNAVRSLPSTDDKESRRERQKFLLNALLFQEPRIAGAA
jgi:tetratricopeptide (TPR) repeat protein